MELGIQDHSQPDHPKDPRAVELGQRGGQKRMAQLSFAERSALSKQPYGHAGTQGRPKQREKKPRRSHILLSRH